MIHFSNIVVRIRLTEDGKRRESFEADLHDAPARMFLPRNSDITDGTELNGRTRLESFPCCG